MTLFLLPQTWMLIGIFGIFAWFGKISKATVTGMVCYALSFALSNAYTLVLDYGLAVPVWQASLLAILGMYCIVSKSWWPILLGCIAYGVHQLGVGRRPFELFLMVLIATTVYLAYRKVEFLDPPGKLVWVVVLVAEGLAAIEYGSCQFVSQPSVESLMQTWGVTASKYSCGRAYGDLAPHVAPILTTTALVWVGVLWKYRKLRRS